MLRLLRRSVAAAPLLLLAGAGQAQPPSRADCEAAHPASWGRAGKHVVWVPTFDAVALAMLSMAQVTPQDLVLDLGAGDGKIAIAAAKAPFGARAVGIEYDPELAKRATCLVQAEGLADRVRIVEGDACRLAPVHDGGLGARPVGADPGARRPPVGRAGACRRRLVRGGEITGVLSTGTAARTAVGRLLGTLRGAPWAEMPPDCSRYYDR